MRKSESGIRFVPFALVLIGFVSAGAAGGYPNVTVSLTPPRGWNSYDSFSWVITEEEFLDNAEYVAANLLKHGYEYVVVDFLWYRKQEDGASPGTSGHDIIDKWGRLVPDPVRWPSSKGGKGFKPIADKVHAMGLKFGIHIMRGISTAAVEKNTRILGAKGTPEGSGGRPWQAKDIAIPGGECSWMNQCFIRVNTSSEGGRAFINSLHRQYSEWDVDFIKHDCVFGIFDLDVDEITTVGKAMESNGRPMVYSLSPGVFATPELGRQVAHLSHMYRITMDDWDRWSDILAHFSVARDFAASGLVGSPGLAGGRSWPDMDMLPIGWLTDPDVNYGPYRSTSLTRDEQMTQITLWAMAKSPLMFGGDLRNIDPWTYELITQPTILELNAKSTHNRELSSSVQSSLPEVVLENCLSAQTTYWTLKNSRNGQDELCWSRFARPRHPNGQQVAVPTRCLDWKDSPWTTPYLSAELLNNSGRRGQLQSSTADTDCLDSSSSVHNGSVETVPFSRCNGSASQVWHLTDEGRLVSEKEGHCATVLEAKREWKVWVARGAEGQSYVAFFNLGSKATKIRVAVGEIEEHVNSNDLEANAECSIRQFAEVLENWRLKFLQRSDEIYRQIMRRVHPNLNVPDGESLPRRFLWTCVGLDVWNNMTFTGNMTTLEAVVESHGTLLFELRCKPGPTIEPGSMRWYFLVSSLLLVVLMGSYFLTDFRSWFTYRRFHAAKEVVKEAVSLEEVVPLRTEKSMQDFSAL